MTESCVANAYYQTWSWAGWSFMNTFDAMNTCRFQNDPRGVMIWKLRPRAGGRTQAFQPGLEPRLWLQGPRSLQTGCAASPGL